MCSSSEFLSLILVYLNCGNMSEIIANNNSYEMARTTCCPLLHFSSHFFFFGPVRCDTITLLCIGINKYLLLYQRALAFVFALRFLIEQVRLKADVLLHLTCFSDRQDHKTLSGSIFWATVTRWAIMATSSNII